MSIENITYSSLAIIPTKCNPDGSNNNYEITGYSTDGGTHAEVSKELNNVVKGGFLFQDPQALSNFSITYFAINMDTNTPYPGYTSTPPLNGGASTIKWPAPHMVCIVEGTVVCRDFSQAGYGQENTQTLAFKHTLVRDAFDPDVYPGTHYQEFEVVSNPQTNLDPILASTSIVDNNVSYNSSLNTWNFKITPYDEGLANRMYIVVQGTYLLL